MCCLTMPALESPTLAHMIKLLCSRTSIPVLPLKNELTVGVSVSLVLMSTQTASSIEVYSSLVYSFSGSNFDSNEAFLR